MQTIILQNHKRETISFDTTKIGNNFCVGDVSGIIKETGGDKTPPRLVSSRRPLSTFGFIILYSLIPFYIFHTYFTLHRLTRPFVLFNYLF